MRKLITTLLCTSFFVTLSLYGQQEAQYTQFMFNKLALNAAYAGSAENASFSVLHRSQWVGLEGAPRSQALNFHTPLEGNRVGVGMTILNDKIGPTRSWSYQLKYSYRIPIANGHLGVGMQGSVRRFRVDWNLTNAIQSGDGLLLVDPASKVFPNFGAGLYYQNQNFYLGASVPNILRNDLTFYEGEFQGSEYSREDRHYYFMGGLILNEENNVKFKPSVLVKYVKNAPVSIDINATAIFFENFWIGTSYRMGGDKNESIGESIDAIVQYQLNRSLRAGLSFDFSLSKMRGTNAGTYEIVVEYCIVKNDHELMNPRYF